MKITTSTKEVGDAFESRVARYYEALGFRVERNASIRGHQIDLLVSKFISGASIISYMVEAKFREGSLVGVNEVTPFVNTARDLIQSGDINGAVMVTNGGYSDRAAGKSVGSRTIKLMTASELEAEIFNSSESLFRICADYEQSSIDAEYIPLAAEAIAHPAPLAIDDVSVFLADWAARETGLITVTADFGAGKTTILERLFYDTAKARISNHTGRYPVLLRLRSLLSHTSLWAFISAQLRDHQYVNPPKAAFEAMRDQGGFLFLLDGFDEINTGATAVDRARYLERLAPLLTSPSPCIITTRPTYFESFSEMNRILQALLKVGSGFDRVEDSTMDMGRFLRALDIDRPMNLPSQALAERITLTPLDEDQIRTYLSRFRPQILSVTGHDDVRLLEFLYRIYDLKDLLRRPMLLKMVLVVALENKFDLTRDDLIIGPSTLYEIYTQICAERDVSKKGGTERPRNFLSRDERLEGCRRIAMAMARKGAIELQTSEVLDAIRSMLIKRTKAMKVMDEREVWDRAVTDIRVCSFLSFTDTGVLQFAHRSFFEFFVAQSLVLGLGARLDTISDFARLNLGKEIVDFLGSYARDMPSFAADLERASKARGMDHGPVDALFARIYWASASLLERGALVNVEITDSDLQRACVEAACFENVGLVRCVLLGVKARNWKASFTLSQTLFESVDFTGGEIGLRSQDVLLLDCSFVDSKIQTAGDKWFVEICSVSGGSVDLNAPGHYSAVVLRDTSLLIGEVFEAQGKSAISVHDSVVRHAGGTNWYAVESQIFFERCVLMGLQIDASDAAALLGRSDSSTRPLRFVQCTGLVLTSDPRGQLIGKEGFVQVAPDLIVASLDMVKQGLESRSRATLTRSDGKAKRVIVEDAPETVAMRRMAAVLKGVEGFSRNLSSLPGGLVSEAMKPAP